MRHYEICMLIHPDQSDQVPAMQERYQDMVLSQGGSIHRNEDSGRRSLAYPIRRSYKAHYLVLNIECTTEVVQQLDHAFRFNDAIMRYLIINMPKAITEPSALLKREKQYEGKAFDSDNTESSRGRE